MGTSVSPWPKVYVLDVLTWHAVAQLEGHEEDVSSCAWCPDGTRLASTSDDETVIIWDATRWREVAKLTGRVDNAMLTTASNAL
jgi:WD40 repeat protein